MFIEIGHPIKLSIIYPADDPQMGDPLRGLRNHSSS
jgi:hypothetical protein